MSNIINFGMCLPSSCFKHIKEMSHYDYNFYKVEPYGDWFYGDLNIILQQYNECANCYSYQLGKMIDGKFEAFVYWTITEDIFE